ncbi:hypothetical protein FRC02_010637 [Tulasnella sp. 418]|nr:hypothetical protein FRC02_010637 [Tulasnella sp. 418]
MAERAQTNYSYTSRSTIEDDDRLSSEFVPHNDNDESQGDSSSDFSMETASVAPSSNDRASIFKPPSIASSGSDMSISIASRDEIYPHDSVSQRAAEEQSDISEVPSVVSYNSSVDGHLFRELFGRAFAAQNDSYILPADDIEHSRLDRQHDLLKYDLGNCLYAAPDLVRKVLRPGQAQRPSVLDVGTGSGRWALEMAAEFPHADIVGLDLAPPTLTDVSTIPPNCRFEVDNANLPLDHYANCFDVVHCRCVELGIVDFHAFLYNVAQTLKPGGVLLLCSGYAQLFDEQHRPLPVTVEGDPKFTWIQRVFGEAYAALLARQDNALDAKDHWDEWVDANPNFEYHFVRDRFIPIGPWPEGLNDMQRYSSELMRYNCSTILFAYKPLLRLEGFPPDVIDRMIENAIEEIQELRARAYVKWRYGVAIRSSTPWTEKLETPVPVESAPSVIFSDEYKSAKANSASSKSPVNITPASSVV